MAYQQKCVACRMVLITRGQRRPVCKECDLKEKNFTKTARSFKASSAIT